MLIILLILIYILSVVFVHLYYRIQWIKYLEKNRDIEKNPDKTLNGFYTWIENSNSTTVCTAVFWIPGFNTITAFCLVSYLIVKKIGNIKFV